MAGGQRLPGVPMKRGQALVETALGLLVMVTVFIFGLHFSELGYLSLKVHEAAASALWDSTAYRVHRPGADALGEPPYDWWYDSMRVAGPEAQSAARSRYADFDGRTSTSGQPPSLVFTRAEELAVECAAKKPPVDRSQLTPAFDDPGTMSCVAAGKASAVRIPKSFDEQGGHFQEAHYSFPGAMSLCSTGRALGGVCQGKLSLLLGDFGLTDDPENKECPRQNKSVRCKDGNYPFYYLTKELWDRSPKALGLDWTDGYLSRPKSNKNQAEWFTKEVTGEIPDGKVTGFYTSLRGEESGFAESAPGNDDTPGGVWQTTPMDQPGWTQYRDSYRRRDSCSAGGFCYLGKYPTK